MTDTHLRDTLRDLAQREVDAVHACATAMAAADVLAVRDALGDLRLAHLGRLRDLERARGERAGAEDPSVAAPDLRGQIVAALAAVRALASAAGAVRALRDVERLLSAAYAGALAQPLPEDVLELARAGHDAAGSHLRTLDLLLADLESARGAHA